MIATCLRAAIFMSIEPNGAAAVKKSQSHGDATWPYRRCSYPELGRPDRPVRDHHKVSESRGKRDRRTNQQGGHEGPQTPAKAGRLREKRVRGGPARALAICLVQRRRVSRAWRTTLPTVLSSKKRSRLGRAVCNSSGKPTRLYADSRL